MTIYMKQKEKKRIKQCKILSLIMAVIVMAMSFGCQRPMTTKEREERLKELLKDKYGEEFEVRELYVTGAVEAWCYPVNDFSRIFKIETMLDMENITEDDYLQSIVAAQINEELQPLADNSFGDCYVYSNILLASTSGFLDPKASAITLQKLYEYMESNNYGDSIHINVFVNSSNSNSDYSKEFVFIENIGNMIKEKKLSSSTKVVIYYGDKNFTSSAQKAIAEFGWNTISNNSRIDIMDVINNRDGIRVYFNSNGEPMNHKNNADESSLMDVEEYRKKRMEVIK